MAFAGVENGARKINDLSFPVKELICNYLAKANLVETADLNSAPSKRVKGISPVRLITSLLPLAPKSIKVFWT